MKDLGFRFFAVLNEKTTPEVFFPYPYPRALVRAARFALRDRARRPRRRAVCFA